MAIAVVVAAAAAAIAMVCCSYEEPAAAVAPLAAMSALAPARLGLDLRRAAGVNDGGWRRVCGMTVVRNTPLARRQRLARRRAVLIAAAHN